MSSLLQKIKVLVQYLKGAVYAVIFSLKKYIENKHDLLETTDSSNLQLWSYYSMTQETQARERNKLPLLYAFPAYYRYYSNIRYNILIEINSTQSILWEFAKSPKLMF